MKEMLLVSNGIDRDTYPYFSEYREYWQTEYYYSFFVYKLFPGDF